jgi:hypothetical protein
MDAGFEARWAERRAAVFRGVLGLFLERGGPGSSEAAAGVIVWVGPRPDADARACATL